MIAYDSPMLGLNPTLFSNTAQQYIDHATTAQQVVGLGTSWWNSSGGGSSSSSSKSKKGRQKEETEVITAPKGGGGGGGGWVNARTAGALGGTLWVISSFLNRAQDRTELKTNMRHIQSGSCNSRFGVAPARHYQQSGSHVA